MGVYVCARVCVCVCVPSMTPPLGRAELQSRLRSRAETPKSFRSRSSNADSATPHRVHHKAQHECTEINTSNRGG